MKYDLFISYSRKDFEEVSALIGKIKAALPGISYWFDINGIESGDEFEDKIISAIDNSSYVLFALSRNSLQSQWTKDEVMYAKNTGKKVIPVLLKGAELEGWFLFRFGRVDCIDFTDRLQMDKLIHNLATWTENTLAGSALTSSEEKVSGSEHVPKPMPEQTDVFCPCGSGKLFKDCHGMVVAQTPASKPVKKTWKVGDYYNVDGKEGVVFWIDGEGHGKIVSSEQYELRWGVREVFEKGLSVGASDKEDGMRNLRTIRQVNDWYNKYPAFASCYDKGDDWYLPAIEELKVLLLNKDVHEKVNAMLLVKGKTLLSSKGEWATYWSSSENDGFTSTLIGMSKGTIGYGNKHFAASVRAVATF